MLKVYKPKTKYVVNYRYIVAGSVRKGKGLFSSQENVDTFCRQLKEIHPNITFQVS